MKLSVSWLREWVKVPWSVPELAHRLTMAGFEVEAIEAAAPPFAGVIVGEILSAEAHPQADKLRLCTVAVGGGETLQIVCGAPNARVGLRAPLARVGAVLPGELTIKAARLRGVESFGMLCSARELGLGEGEGGLLELDAGAPIGADLRQHLDLDDTVLEISITPNRGDAMSVLGLAREIAALSGTALELPPAHQGAAAHGEVQSVVIEPHSGGGRFAGCVLRHANNHGSSPLWVRERLRRAGLRAISPIVDVTNYVLLELGQPLHAYDLDRLDGEVRVRRGRPAESLTLLDGRAVQIDEQVLVIADAARALGLAGVMGGAHSAVSASTRSVLLEAAWFTPAVIAGRARRFGLLTDASQRFERGVDPDGQVRAAQRAVALLGEFTGAAAGPIVVCEQAEALPQRPTVGLRESHLERLIGAKVAADQVQQRLGALGMALEAQAHGWRVRPPSWRFDITLEVDLIEEVLRLGGLDAVPELTARGAFALRARPEGRVSESTVLHHLGARGYQEIISFGFTDPALQRLLFAASEPVALTNPIASNLGVMRLSLWPGLIQAAQENLRRQQVRVRLCEIGARFLSDPQGVTREQRMIGGIRLGAREPEQWSVKAEPTDFYDLKGDVEALLGLSANRDAFRFEAAALPCLHPGRSARVLREGVEIGFLGELHPDLVRALDFTYSPWLFEVDYAGATQGQAAAFRGISRFPQVRRDISFTVDRAVTFSAIRDRVTVIAAGQLRELRLFDVYQGPGVESSRKSIALGLILQDISRTLTDADADDVVARVVAELCAAFDAKIRE